MKNRWKLYHCLYSAPTRLNNLAQVSVRNKIMFFTFFLLIIVYWIILPNPLFKVPYSTVVYDKKGELLGARVASDGQWRFPAQNTYSDKFTTCIIESEDKWFYYHWGINPISIARACKQNIKNHRIVSGASTITMQTIRLSRQKKRTYWEKLIEFILATRMELSYSKTQILNLYTAHAPFGGNVVGLEAATWRYFNHPSNELSWAEAATLAVLPNAPSFIHPGKNQQQLKQKRNNLLKRLYIKNKISKEDYELALAEDLPLQTYQLPHNASHLVDFFNQQKKGQQITTTIDLNIQEQIEQTVLQWSATLSEQKINNMAVLVVDVTDNEVVAYCANALGLKNGTQSVDIIRSRRSTGSILKPFLYCATLQEGLILPHTLLPDIPININGFSPQNYNYSYDGAVPANEALARSLNIPSVMLLKQYSVPKFYNFLKKIGISTLDRTSDNYGLSLILGGAEATLWDIVQAYAKMNNSLQEKTIKDLKIEQYEQPTTYKELFDPASVWFTFDAMKDLNRPDELDITAITSLQTIAWKTGTSYGNRDAWAVGVNKKYVVGVWVGNATGEGNVALIGRQTAGPILFNVFNLLPKSKWFAIPEKYMIEENICQQSGHLCNRFCPDKQKQLIPAKGLQSTICPYHQLHIDKENNEQGSAVFVLPPVWAYFYKRKHIDYQSDYSTTQTLENRPMQFIYPTNTFSKITLPEQADGQKGEIVFELVHQNNDAEIFWHIDGEYFTKTTDFHNISVYLPNGRHNITAIDNEGNSQTIVVVVE